MKKSLIFFLTFLLSLLLCSCLYVPSKKNSVYYNDRVDLLVLYEYSIPFVNDLDLGMEGDVEIYSVEEDDFGRTLGILQYNRAKKNIMFGDNAIYCVLQSGNKTECCFYEDVCCVLVKNGADYKVAIEKLKQDNDWNLPLSLDQCRKIPIKSSWATGAYDNYLGYVNNRTIISIYEETSCEAVGWEKRDISIDVICRDGNQLWLFVLSKDMHSVDAPVYLIMMQEPSENDNDELLSIVGTHLLENRDAPWKEIRSFKQEMGWNFANQP